MHTSQTGLGFNPFHAVARAAKGVEHGVATGARAAGHGVVKVGKIVGKVALAPYEFSLELTKAATRLALRPVTSRVRTLEKRRAAKIAWDKRKSRTPTPAEKAEAKAWTKSQLRKQLPHGPLLAMLAGPLPMPVDMGSMSTNLGIAPAVIAALIPVFIALVNSMLHKFASNGQAPIAIGPNGQIITAGDPTAVPDAAADEGPPPGSDPNEVAQDVAAAGGDDGSSDGGGATMPGGKKGNLIMIGGLVIGVVLVASLFKSKPKSKK
ncbi:MAG TPA: hypothetical protein VGY48_15180 [Vicinamibacterales bacterium]|jgi:hypothetical protein|nr:hypothetical protein [Vicinamibacterales bacterium]